MTDQDIREYVEKTIQQKLLPEHWEQLKKRDFRYPVVVEVLTTKYNFGKVGAGEIADNIAAMMKKASANTATASKKSRWTRRALISGLVIIIAGLCWRMCSISGRVDSMETKSVKDVSRLQYNVDMLNAQKTDVDARIDGVIKSIGELNKSTSETAKATADLAKQVDAMNTELEGKVDVTEYSDKMAKLEDRLMSKYGDLKRVERKLDAHIADDDEIEMPADDESAALPPGEVHVTIHQVPVDDE